MHLIRKLAGALRMDFRRGAARTFDRARLADSRVVFVKLDAIGDFVISTTCLQFARRRLRAENCTLVCRAPVAAIARQQLPGWTVIELPPKGRALKTVYSQGSGRRMLRRLAPFDLLVDLRAMRDMSDTAVASWIPARMKLAAENQYPPHLEWVTALGEGRIYDLLLPVRQDRTEGVTDDILAQRALAAWLLPDEPGAATAMPRVEVTDAEKRELAAFLSERFAFDAAKPFLLVCPGARAAIREYPVPLLVEALDAVRKTAALPLVVAGSAGDARTTGPLLAALAASGEVVDLTGALSLPQHVALMSVARAVLCMETSHAHIAGALGTPAVVIIGGGHYGIFAPWGGSPAFRWLTNKLPCFGCHWRCIYDRPLCIHDVPPDEVARNLVEVLQQAEGWPGN